MYKIILFLTFTTELFNTNLLIKSYGRNPMVSKELFKDDNKDILVIQDQIKNMEECLLKDENIASAVDASNMDLAKTLSAKHCVNFQHYTNRKYKSFKIGRWYNKFVSK